MPSCHFRLSDNQDPEERLEEAALWKAMYDEFGDEIMSIATDVHSDLPLYGRPRSRERVTDLPYWRDPAFLANCGREFRVAPLQQAKAHVMALHDRGLGAFVKSCRPKHWIGSVPIGQTLLQAMDGMEYSFIDGGPELMVQELAQVKHEWRFFAIGRQIVTYSPNATHLTPIDYPCLKMFETPSSRTSTRFDTDIFWPLHNVATEIAATMQGDDAVIDCALINGQPGCVELNPMIVGGVGLFACDVRSLARAAKEAHPRLARSSQIPF